MPADVDAGAGLGEVAVDVSEGDGRLQQRRVGRTRYLADRPVARTNRITARRNGGSDQLQTDQTPRDSPVAAVEHPDDDFLTDVAAFRPADRAILDPRFEGDRVITHVDTKTRTARFDPRRLHDSVLHR